MSGKLNICAYYFWKSFWNFANISANLRPNLKLLHGEHKGTRDYEFMKKSHATMPLWEIGF